MVQEIAKEIKQDIDNKLDSMLNKRKIKENLISVKNQMLIHLQKHINEWYNEEIKNSKDIDKLIDNFKTE